ncbi:hypothetical protein BV25DRAFT_1839697 [Artomyces pyxidatus]|uniref:Uncharacterized protein n=1 Tax=Artomyces pyxidatus TaxID=48021 RepID=A0ACB8SVL2_9AGAM|nr:hypothetical protein BV25DRAFT_1839697 [Artomyces pyxidatus]
MLHCAQYFRSYGKSSRSKLEQLREHYRGRRGARVARSCVEPPMAGPLQTLTGPSWPRVGHNRTSPASPDSVSLANERTRAVAVIKLQHVLGGLYIVVVGAGPYRWTIWVYTLCRLSALLHAIWKRRIPPTAIAAAAWLASIALNIRSLPVSHAYAVPFPTGLLSADIGGLGYVDSSMGTCVNTDVDRALPNAIGILVSDLVLLCVMLAGILRSKDMRMFGIRKLLFYQTDSAVNGCAAVNGLWRLAAMALTGRWVAQGVSWLAVAAIAEIPTIVFIPLNLNDVSACRTTVGATRMYRGLMLYGSATDVGAISLQGSMEVYTKHGIPAARHAPTSRLRFRESDETDGAYHATGSLECQGAGVDDKV